MKGLIVSFIALSFGAAVLADEAQAARLGGGRSLGSQRQVTAPPKQATPPAQQQKPASAPQPAGPRWLGPIAGLAAGLGLGWLFAEGGLGPVIGTLLMALLAGALVLAVMRILSRGRTRGTQFQYSGFGDETVAAPPPSQLPGDAAERPDYRSQFVSNIPSGFDVEGFLKEARRNFLRLQDANDRGDLIRLRQVTTQEMFEALRGDVHPGSGQQTDVVTLNASLLEVVTERNLHWASVRFSGSMREESSAPPEPFEEIWNLCKPVNGSSGWLLAGIQQTH